MRYVPFIQPLGPATEVSRVEGIVDQGAVLVQLVGPEHEIPANLVDGDSAVPASEGLPGTQGPGGAIAHPVAVISQGQADGGFDSGSLIRVSNLQPAPGRIVDDGLVGAPILDDEIPLQVAQVIHHHRRVIAAPRGEDQLGPGLVAVGILDFNGEGVPPADASLHGPGRLSQGIDPLAGALHDQRAQVAGNGRWLQGGAAGYSFYAWAGGVYAGIMVAVAGHPQVQTVGSEAGAQHLATEHPLAEAYGIWTYGHDAGPHLDAETGLDAGGGRASGELVMVMAGVHHPVAESRIAAGTGLGAALEVDQLAGLQVSQGHPAARGGDMARIEGGAIVPDGTLGRQVGDDDMGQGVAVGIAEAEVSRGQGDAAAPGYILVDGGGQGPVELAANEVRVGAAPRLEAAVPAATANDDGMAAQGANLVVEVGQDGDAYAADAPGAAGMADHQDPAAPGR